MKWYLFGEVRDSERITVEDIKLVMSMAKERIGEIRRVPIAYILDVLSRAGEALEDFESDRVKSIIKIMHNQLGWSEAMVIEGLKVIIDVLKYDNLEARIKADIDDVAYLDEFTYNKAFKGMVKAEPSGVVSHVSAGNVFVSAVDTLVQGIITKNVNILKMSSADPVFPMIFAEILQEVDYKGILSRSFALVPFKGGDVKVESVVKLKSDVLVVYGGEDTVKAYRQGTGLHTKIIEYGPKYSLAILSKDSLNDENMEGIANQLARDFTMWEQSACSSPHAVFIDDEVLASKFIKVLAEQLNYWAKVIPHSAIPLNEAVEITRTRELARVDQALGEAELVIPAINNQDWTLVLQKKCVFKVSPHHRTGFVIISKDHTTDTLNAVKEYGKFIQSIAIVAPTALKLKLSDALVGLGADRITDIGWMTRRKHGTPHDGTRGVSELVRWVSVGSDEPFQNPFDYLPKSERDEITLMRINSFLHYTKTHSQYYADKLPKEDLKSLSEISKLPILSPDELKANLPPKGKGLLTRELGDSISYSSGGTTGDPKCIFRTMEETHENARLIGKGYALSVFERGDVVTNLLYAGNMWASFLSHNEALEAVGAHTLPIAGNISIDAIIGMLKAYKPIGAISIPSVILSIAEYVDKNNVEGVTLKKIVTGGEHLFPEAKKYISKVLKTEIFASTGYLSNDTGCIGFECEEQIKTSVGTAIHHIHESYCYMEVVDPETNQPVPDGTEGKILVTNFTRRLMPLVRYDIGDMGRIIPEPCPCGRTVKQMELLGRSDDVLIIGAGNTALSAISKVVGMLPELSMHFRMTASTEGHKDLLTVEVETIRHCSDAELKALSEKLYETLIRNDHNFETMVSTGTICKPKTIVLNPDTLPRNPRTGKLKQVIDKRI